MARLALLIFFFTAALWIPHRAGGQQLHWLTEYDQAMRQATASGKPILLYFFSDTCVLCVKMEKEVFTSAPLVRTLKNYIPLQVDAGDNQAGSALSRRYNITAPTVLVLDSTGLLLNRISGYREPQHFIAELQTVQELVQLEKANPNDWYTIQELAQAYLNRDMNQEAEIRFQRLLRAPVGETVKDSATFSVAMAQYYQQKKTEAVATLNTYIRMFPNGVSLEDAFLLLAQIQIELNNGAQAKEILTEFLRRFPASKNASRAREVLNKL